MATPVVFVSQKGTGFTGAEKKSIMKRFAFFPLAERKLFVSAGELVSQHGFQPTNYFGYRLKCVDGRPVWDDVPASRSGESLFNNKQVRNALENVSLMHLKTAALNEPPLAIDLDVMIASHCSGSEENAVFSISYAFMSGKLRHGGALFVSGGSRYDSAVVHISQVFADGHGGLVTVSTVREKY